MHSRQPLDEAWNGESHNCGVCLPKLKKRFSQFRSIQMEAEIYKHDPGLKPFVAWLAGMNVDYFGLAPDDQAKFRNMYDLSPEPFILDFKYWSLWSVIKFFTSSRPHLKSE
jgi:hypothetical protein